MFSDPGLMCAAGFILGNFFCFFTLYIPVMRLKDKHYDRLELKYKKAKGWDE